MASQQYVFAKTVSFSSLIMCLTFISPARNPECQLAFTCQVFPSLSLKTSANECLVAVGVLCWPTPLLARKNQPPLSRGGLLRRGDERSLDGSC